MLTITQIAGFAGAGLSGAAYVPQLSHLIRARCSAGLSRLAFGAWLLASVLVTARAIAIGAGVFIVLGGIQIAATALILVCAVRYKDTSCLSHLPHRPAAKTATDRAPRETSPRFLASARSASGRLSCTGRPRRGTASARPRPGPAIPCGH
jgi:PQ loop repeat